MSLRFPLSSVFWKLHSTCEKINLAQMGSNGLKLVHAWTKNTNFIHFCFFPYLPLFWKAALNSLKTQSGSNVPKMVENATETSKFILMSLRFLLSFCFFEVLFNL